MSDEYEAGRVQHHSSDGSHTDVGVLIGLGGGKALWLGERTNREGGGMGLLIYSETGVIENAEIGDFHEMAAVLTQHVAPALAKDPAA